MTSPQGIPFPPRHQSWAQTGRLALRWQSSGLRACRQQHLLSTLRCRSHQGAQNLAEASLDSVCGHGVQVPFQLWGMSHTANQGLLCGAGEWRKHKDGLPWHRAQVDDDKKKQLLRPAHGTVGATCTTLSALWVTMSC